MGDFEIHIRWSERFRDGVCHVRGVALAHGQEFQLTGEAPVDHGDEMGARCRAKRRALIGFGMSASTVCSLPDEQLIPDSIGLKGL